MPAFLKKWSLSRTPWRSITCCWCSSNTERKGDCGLYFGNCGNFWSNSPDIRVQNPTGTGVRSPTDCVDLEGGNCCCLCVVCLSVFRRHFLWCIGMCGVCSGLETHSALQSETSNSVHWLNEAGYLCLPSMALPLMYPVPLFILYLHSPELSFIQNKKELAVYSTVTMSKNKNN